MAQVWSGTFTCASVAARICSPVGITGTGSKKFPEASNAAVGMGMVSVIFVTGLDRMYSRRSVRASEVFR
jgi:hypothetical protein